MKRFPIVMKISLEKSMEKFYQFNDNRFGGVNDRWGKLYDFDLRDYTNHGLILTRLNTLGKIAKFSIITYWKLRYRFYYFCAVLNEYGIIYKPEGERFTWKNLFILREMKREKDWEAM